MAIVGASMACSICVGRGIGRILQGRNFSWRSYSVIGVMTCIIVAVIMVSGSYGRYDVMPLLIYIHIANGKMREFDEAHRRIFSILEDGADKGVVIEDYLSDMGILQSIWLKPDVSAWTNQGIANGLDAARFF